MKQNEELAGSRLAGGYMSHMCVYARVYLYICTKAFCKNQLAVGNLLYCIFNFYL